ncbi:glycosyltransferase family A protein [Pseudalkalibacillus hwajinpoensis]|uniref:glycosyltransferase n=1 Tax=Guptibacillus hwajinpoensis TaxID=208199 RepID=UPI00325A9889
MISVITCTNREKSLTNILSNYDKQHYKHKELVIIINNNSIDLNEWKSKSQKYKNVTILREDENQSLGKCLNKGIQHASGYFIAKFDDDDYYSSHYLSESLKALQNAKVNVVGKTSIYMFFESEKLLTIFNPYKFAGSMSNSEEVYNNAILMGGTLFVKKSVFHNIGFRDTSVGEDAAFCEDCKLNGIKIFSSTIKGYVYIRKEENSHSWKMKNDKLKKFCTVVEYTEDYKSKIDY